MSFGRRYQPSLQQFGFLIKAPATVISVTVLCIIVCSGSRSSKENVSVTFLCSVKILIKTGVRKTVVLLHNNLNGLKKRVEDISVDPVLGSKSCLFL